MRYTISGVKKTPIAKKDGTGTWTKIEVKTEQTGDQVLELGFTFSKKIKDGIKKGDILIGYVESKPWTTSSGKSGVNMVLQGITADYVYSLLLKISPDIEEIASEDNNNSVVSSVNESSSEEVESDW